MFGNVGFWFNGHCVDDIEVYFSTTVQLFSPSPAILRKLHGIIYILKKLIYENTKNNKLIEFIYMKITDILAYNYETSSILPTLSIK